MLVFSFDNELDDYIGVDLVSAMLGIKVVMMNPSTPVAPTPNTVAGAVVRSTLDPQPINFSPLKKRRKRSILKRFPFVMRAQHCDFPQRDRIEQYLRDHLGEAHKDWHCSGFDFYFTKREHAMMVVTRFRGTM